MDFGKLRSYSFKGKSLKKKHLPFFVMKIINGIPIIAWILVGVLGCGAVLAVILLFGEKQVVENHSVVSSHIAQALNTNAQMSDAIPTHTPASSTMVVQKEFVSLLDQNADTVGWLAISGTRIDYPVLQGDDNSFYMENDFNKNKAVQGSIFLDASCDYSNMEGNYVLYGHNMKDGGMFADLLKYKEKDFFEENSIIVFNTIYRDYKWEIFSVYVAPVSFNYIDTTFLTQESWEKYISNCKCKSMYENDVVPEADDIVLTLSTCAYDFDNARFVVQARMIKH